MKDYLKFEYKKYKGTYLIPIIFILTIFIVGIQGYAGYVTEEILTEVLYITAMDIFTMIVLPMGITSLVFYGFFIEKREMGILNYYMNNISIDYSYKIKVIFFYIVGCLIFTIALIISGIYIHLRCGNTISLYLSNWQYIVFSYLAVLTLVNIQVFLTIISKSYIMPLFLGIVLTFGAQFINAFNLWYINPWGYLSALPSLRDMTVMQSLYFIVVFILSNILMVICKKRAKAYLMN